MLVDTHAHLGWNRFDPDRDEVVARALEVGVQRIITIGTNLASSAQALELAERYPQVYAAVGIHPTDVLELPEGDDWLTEVASMAGHPKVVAIGETGLDHFHAAPEGHDECSYHQRQAEVYRLQLELAESLAMPVIVHQRECYEELVKVTRPFDGRVSCVFHSWTHGWSKAAPLIAAGHLISFTGVVTFPSAREVQEAARQVPEGSFMVETDCPFLSPVPHRGKRNEPAYVQHVAETIARLRGTNIDTIATETGQTAADFFAWSQAPPERPQPAG